MATKTSKSTTTSVKPLNDHILVRPAEAEEKTKGGIILPDTAREKPAQGAVVALGEGRLLDNGSRATFQLKVGDKVIYSKYGGTEVKYGGEDLLVLSARDVLAVVVR